MVHMTTNCGNRTPMSLLAAVCWHGQVQSNPFFYDELDRSDQVMLLKSRLQDVRAVIYISCSVMRLAGVGHYRSKQQSILSLDDDLQVAVIRV